MIKTRARATRWHYPILLTLLSLSGCSLLPAQPEVAELPTEPEPQTAVEPAAQQEELPIRPFEAETLFDLLVADMAGASNDYALQLNRYSKQAFATRDPGLAERATWLAVRLNASGYALKLSQLWVELSPQNIDANRIAAHYLAHSRQLTKAFPLAMFVLQQGDDEPLHTLASLTSTADEAQRAELLNLYQAMDSELANHSEVILAKANLLRQQGDYQQSMAEAQRIQHPEKAHESALLLIAQIHHQQDSLEAGLASLEQSLLLMPDSKRLRLQLARLWSEKDLERSRQELNKLVAQFPDDNQLVYTLALVSAQTNLTEQAKQLLQQLLDSPEHTDNAHFQLGRLLEQEGDNERAMTHYGQVDKGQHLMAAASRLARLQAKAQDIPEMRARLQLLRQQQPGHAIDLYQLEADVLASSQQLQQSRDLLTSALKRFPNHTQLLYARSLASERTGDHSSAHQDLRTILKRAPNNSMALNALGYSLANHTNRYEEAHQLLSKALQLEPDNAAILDSFGWVLFRLKRYEEALPYLRRALELLPDPEVAAHLGEVLWSMGNKEEALAVWRQSLATNPGPTFVTRTMERLAVPQAAVSEEKPTP